MKFAIAFALLGFALLLLAWLYGGFAWLLLWPACNFFVVSLAYAGLGPRLLGKRPDGRLSWWSLAFFLPYFSLTWALWHLQRLLSREPAFQEVTPGLWLGRRLLPNEIPRDIQLVVDLTAEFIEPAGVRQGREYACLPTLDGSVPSRESLAELIEKIVRHPGPVLIHCASGHGRSAMIVACVLVARKQAEDCSEAEKQLRKARPRVGLSACQRRLVKEYHDSCFVCL